MSNLIIFGNSGSGKTTIADYLVDKYNFLHIHPLGHFKRFLENYFECPSLDTKEGKDFIVDFNKVYNWDRFEHECYWQFCFKNKNLEKFFIKSRLNYKTLGQIIIDLYHHCQKHNINLNESYLKSTLNSGENKVYLAIRNEYEALILNDLQEYSLIYLRKPNENKLDTDNQQHICFSILKDKAKYIYKIDNNDSKEELFKKIDNIYLNNSSLDLTLNYQII